ncbi:hypothetical protein O181_003300 [Austropuccinia psidii MF-1]|uniref:CCHC-type domain-containing protein n=1 Tax=Austropuccinia psidii MF-1 TaxID=1389203 RepID=A0A9Q3GDS3_9BASI|nr:hypothetical protein [Austropuccinia psidii MF-1]
MEKTESQRIIPNKRNYAAWTFSMQAKLRNINCLEYVEGIQDDPSGEKKVKSYCLLTRYINETVVSFISNKMKIKHEGDGRVLCNLLKEKFIGSSIQVKGAALDQFLDLKFKTLDQWIEDLPGSTRKVELSGVSIEHDIISRIPIRALPSKFESLVRVITHGNRYPSIEDMISCLEFDQSQFGKMLNVDKMALTADRNNPKSYTCYSCGKAGHTAKYCFNWINNQNKRRIHQARLAQTESSSKEQSIAFVAVETCNTTEGESLVAGIQKQTILDSGASNHMFNNKEEFEEIEEINGSIQIGQEGVKIPIKGRGRVVKYFYGKKLIFEKALYVSQLPYNLISLTQLWNRGGDLKKIGNTSFSIIKNKKRIFGGKIDNGLLHIQFDNQKAMISKHEHLSHSGTEKGCEACHLGKATRSQFKNKIEHNTDQIE